MPVRVRHAGNDLYPEGVVEVLEADQFEVVETPLGLRLDLFEVEEAVGRGKRTRRYVGCVPAGQWQSALVVRVEA